MVIRCDDNMPELTQEELTQAWIEWQWNYEDDRRRNAAELQAFEDEFERYLASIAAERIDNPTYWPDEEINEDIDYD